MNVISENQKQIVTNLVIDMAMIIRDMRKTYDHMVESYQGKHISSIRAWRLEYNADIENMLNDVLSDTHNLWLDINSSEIYDIDEIEEKIHDILGTIIHDRKMFARDGFVYKGYNSLYDLTIDFLKDFKDLA